MDKFFVGSTSMDKTIRDDLGFEKYSTNNKIYYCGYLKNGDCVEVVVGDKIDVNFVNFKNNYAKLCEFKKDVELGFLKRYLTSLILVLNR